MEEMMEDTLAMDEDEELEEEADAEVDKVLFDLTNGKLGQAGAVRTELPVSSCLVSDLDALVHGYLMKKEDQLEDEETERAMEQYRKELNGLLSG